MDCIGWLHHIVLGVALFMVALSVVASFVVVLLEVVCGVKLGFVCFTIMYPIGTSQIRNSTTRFAITI